MNRNRGRRLIAGLALSLGAGALAAQAQETEQVQQALDDGGLQTGLSGYQEVPSRWSPATGNFSASMNAQGNIDYQLSYAGVTTPVQAAHLHLGRPGVNGGIIIFLCSNMPNPPADVPACPEMEGEVSGTLTAAGVVGPDEQGIAPGEFEKLVDALNNAAVYANVHTEQYPEGELRGQLGSPGEQQADQEQAGNT